ncbi:Ionotropic receptor 669 [Blattella germanica]|nr:Ionotropic receptor 669 [Blattella germanica]
MEMHFLIVSTTFCFIWSLTCSRNNALLTPTQQHIASYVSKIARRYFKPGVPILVSLPIKNENGDASSDEEENVSEEEGSRVSLIENPIKTEQIHILNSLLVVLNEAMLWPLKVTTLGYTFEISTDIVAPIIRKDEGYLVFTPSDMNSEEIMYDFEDQMIDISGTILWNPKVDFLFVVTDIIAESPHILAEKILRKYWNEYNVLNSLIMIPTVSESSADNKTMIKVNIQTYSWRTHQSKGKCMQFADAYLVDQFFLGMKLNETRENNLKNNKIPAKFEGCPLKVQTPTKNYKIERDQNNETVVKYFEVELYFLDIAMKHLNLSIVYQPPLPVIRNYVQNVVKATTTLVMGDSDIALGYMPIGDEMIQFADSSMPYMFLEVGWYVPCGRMVSRITTLSRIFPFSVWLTLAISLSLSAMTVKLQASCFSFQAETSTYKKFSTSSLLVWAIILGVGVPEMPQSSRVRLFFILFVWYSFAVNMIFQVFFTAYLVNPGTKAQIQNFQKLLDSGIEFGFDPFVEYHINNSPDKRFIKAMVLHQECRDRHYCFGRVDITGDYAYMDLEFLADWYRSVRKDARMCRLDDGTILMMIASHFRKDSVFTGVLDSIFFRLVEAGIAIKLRKEFLEEIISDNTKFRWLDRIVNVTLVDPEAEDYDVKDEYVQYSLIHTQATFYLLFMGYGISSIVIIVELIFYKVYNKYKNIEQ